MTKIKIPLYKIILFKSKTLSNGDHPIMLRVTYQRIRKYYSLKLYSTPEKWNEELGLFNRNKEGNLKLSLFERRAEKTLRTMGDDDQEFSFAKFEQLFFKSSKPVRVFSYWENVIESLKEENRLATAGSYNDALKAFKKFQKNKDLFFTDVSYKLLERYRRYLKTRYSVNTSALYLRSFRVIFNNAIKNKIINRDFYPFEQFKIKTEETVKRALRKSDIEKIHSMKIEKGTRLWHSRNFFLFGYLCQGVNFTDLARLQWDENIYQNRITYRRQKTGKLFSIKVQGKLAGILDGYRNDYKNPDGFIFPILSNGLSGTTMRNRLKDNLKKINKDMKILCKWLEIPGAEKVSYYWCRHSYATALKRDGVQTAKISEALGHSSEKITKIYLDNFDSEFLDEANANLL